jgi:hypothetical protein
MIMKKYFYILATAAIAVSCSNNDALKEVVYPDAPIGFAAYADIATKTNTNNKTNLEFFYSTFNVFGYKYTDAWKEVFDEETNEYFSTDGQGAVVYDGSGEAPSSEWGTNISGWYYEGVRYWDKFAAKYKFGAYAPIEAASEVDFAYDNAAADGVITIGTSSAKITVESTNLMATPAQELAYKGFTKDYMTALANTSTSTSSSPVSLTFAHKLTKFDIKLALNDQVITNQAVVVNEITVHNMNGTSYYDSSKESGETGFLSGWATPVTEKQYSVKGVGNATNGYQLNLDIDDQTAGDQNYDDFYVFEGLMIPQTIQKAATASQLTELDQACLYIKYTIGTEEYVGYYALANMFIGTGSENSYDFEGGKEYILTITVGPAPIYFTPTVTAWTEVPVNYDVQ